MAGPSAPRSSSAVRVLHGPLLTDGLSLGPTRIEVSRGRVISVQPGGSAEGADIRVTDGWITPGLIDLQVNGAGGADFTSAADPGHALLTVARLLAGRGVTAFCPTAVSAAESTILERLETLGPAAPRGGAEALGLHLEGPFISGDKRGVHDPRFIRPPDLAEVSHWLARGRPAIVTLAPEVRGALDVIRRLERAGVVASLGHSAADVAAGAAGLAAGARLGTHLFNAMPPLHHREPGLVGALLASDATVGLIADGQHVDPLVVDVVVRAAGPRRVALVSDALALAGMPPGPGVLGDQAVTSDGRLVRRGDGTIAGSAVLLDACFGNVVRWLPWLEPARALQMATETPAAVLGPEVAARKGRVAPGYDADVVVFTSDWRVLAVLVRGEVVQNAGEG